MRVGLRERFAAIWQASDRFAAAGRMIIDVEREVEDVAERLRDIDRSLQACFPDNQDLDTRFEDFERDTTDPIEDSIKEHEEKIEELGKKLERSVEAMEELEEAYGSRLVRLEEAMDEVYGATFGANHNQDWRKK